MNNQSDFKPVEIKGTPVLKFNVENLNGRIYTKDSINLEPFMKKIKNKTALGELGFPDNFEVCMSNVSHIVENLYIEDDYLKADIRVLETHKGKVLNELLSIGNQIVFRTRAAGVVNEDKTVKIQKLFSIDAIPASEDSFKGSINDPNNNIHIIL